MSGRLMRVAAGCILSLTLPLGLASGAGAASLYAGSAACAPCHQEQYRVFQSSSKKAHTRRQVEKLLPKLSGEEQTTCFRCHATGYGRPGGFVSYAQTPDLGDVGCEACHGAGAAHIALQLRAAGAELEAAPAGASGGEPGGGAAVSPLLVRRPDADVCKNCHTPERGGAPLRFGGAH